VPDACVLILDGVGDNPEELRDRVIIRRQASAMP
jgi:hypothetical protein